MKLASASQYHYILMVSAKMTTDIILMNTTFPWRQDIIFARDDFDVSRSTFKIDVTICNISLDYYLKHAIDANHIVNNPRASWLAHAIAKHLLEGK